MTVYNKNGPAATGQVSFGDRMAGLELHKKAGFLCWRIGTMTEREDLSLQSWWPAMADWEQLAEETRQWAVAQLTAELDALQALEENSPGRTKFALTMRDKLLLYMEALHRITNNTPDEVLDRPMTWAAWRRRMAEEVHHGR